MNLFWRQFKALCIKNWIVAFQHPLLNISRCLILPLAFAILLAFAPNFITNPNRAGLGTVVPVPTLADVFDGSSVLYWADTGIPSGFLSGKDIINHVGKTLNQKQLDAIVQATEEAIYKGCLPNFRGASPCFGAIIFTAFPSSLEDPQGITYTIRRDISNDRIDVIKHDGDVEAKLIPMQWSVDMAILELTTNSTAPKVLHQPYSPIIPGSYRSETPHSKFAGLISSFLGVVFPLVFVALVYHLSGAVATERASQLTSHLTAMGLLDSARILSWHISISILYVPMWTIVSLLWQNKLFLNTNAGIVFLLHILTGLAVTSWSLFAVTPFAKSPQIAAVIVTGVAVVTALIPFGILDPNSQMAALGFFFPTFGYVFAIEVIAGFEAANLPMKLTQPVPGTQLTFLPFLVVLLIDIFVWPCLAVPLERCLYGVKRTRLHRHMEAPSGPSSIPPNIALSIRNLKKVFVTSKFGFNRKRITAIEDLSIDIPKNGIFVLLGANGAGKSTALSVLGILASPTSGSVTYEGGVDRPPRGTIGIVPQKDVLFPELSCLQTLRLWSAIKSTNTRSSPQDLDLLLRDADLQAKIHAPAGTLSGGQKRKLQLAIGLVGDSKVVLVDECTSGVDPLSRRALWKILTQYRNERTIILTTHFLDEADFLADQIAVLASPGALLAQGTPVALKTKHSTGYSLKISFKPDCTDVEPTLNEIREIIPQTILSDSSTVAQAVFDLHSRDAELVANTLKVIESRERDLHIASYDIHDTTIEDVFLHLVSKDEEGDPETDALEAIQLNLTASRSRSPFAQALTVFHKRLLVLRKTWLVVLLPLAAGISGAWWPLQWVTAKGNMGVCQRQSTEPASYLNYPPSLNAIPPNPLSPPVLLATLNSTIPELFVGYNRSGPDPTTLVPINPFIVVQDKEALTTIVSQLKLDIGEKPSFSLDVSQSEIPGAALYMDFEKSDYFLGWDTTWTGSDLFSLMSNLLYNRALNTTIGPHQTRTISPSLGSFPGQSAESLISLQWVVVFGAAMSIFPAFFTIYVAKERHSGIQAMQLSNGLNNPLGLWLGHLLFDCIPTFVVATVVSLVVAFASKPGRFHGVGYLWFILSLYGIVSTLLGYLGAIMVRSPIGAFSLVGLYQFLVFAVYMMAVVVVQFTVLPASAPRVMNAIHFALGVVAPISSLLRAALVSINQFRLICDEENFIQPLALGSITRYGGPILYLIIWGIVLIAVLAHIDVGFKFPWTKDGSILTRALDEKDKRAQADVLAEKKRAASDSCLDPLRVVNVSKSYNGMKVVDNVSFTIPPHSIFVMLGPNGAGKTTTFDIIRGQITPQSGAVLINNASMLLDKRIARTHLGICPQFTAIDSQLSTKEHLMIYGRFKGLNRGAELNSNVDGLLAATGLDRYADRPANKLSGGNQRKLALAIALIGNPPVILIDEFSTGIDAKMKRELWKVLKHVAADKSILLTTHSMEEASWLATKVGIMSKRMLAVGTPAELEARYACLEVHFACVAPGDLDKVRGLMRQIPGARMVEAVSTRFEVPIDNSGTNESAMTLAKLFQLLASQEDFPDFTVGKSTLETAFIRVINSDIDARSVEENERMPRLCGLF